METKIRMHIYTEDIKIHLPRINLNSALRFIKSNLWTSSFVKNQEMKEYIHANRKNLNQFLETTATEMNYEESFASVDNLNILHLLIH